MAESIDNKKKNMHAAWQRFDQRIGFIRRLQKRIVDALQQKIDQEKIQSIKDRLNKF